MIFQKKLGQIRTFLKKNQDLFRKNHEYQGKWEKGWKSDFYSPSIWNPLRKSLLSWVLKCFGVNFYSRGGYHFWNVGVLFEGNYSRGGLFKISVYENLTLPCMKCESSLMIWMRKYTIFTDHMNQSLNHSRGIRNKKLKA